MLVDRRLEQVVDSCEVSLAKRRGEVVERVAGLGSLWGTLIGGVVLGVAQAVGAQINPAYGILAGNLVFLAILAFRPTGLLPKAVNS